MSRPNRTHEQWSAMERRLEEDGVLADVLDSLDLNDAIEPSSDEGGHRRLMTPYANVTGFGNRPDWN